MEIIKVSKLNTCILRMESTLWIFATHWINGRTMLCGGRPGASAEAARKNCPECWTYRPKRKGYGIATRKHGEQHTFGLVELPADVLDQFRSRGIEGDQMAGVTWEMRRRSFRPGWEITQVAQAAEDHIATPDAEIAAHMSVLYGLPEPWTDGDPIGIPTAGAFWDVHCDAIKSRLQQQSKAYWRREE